MAAKKRGLGRGLNALLSSRPAPAPVAEAGADSPAAEEAPVAASPAVGESLRTLPVDLMQRGKYQPRRDMHAESLQDLADSIRAQGLVQPIVVRPIDGGRYEIIAGERRWRAAQLAGLQDVAVVVRQVDDRAAMAMALIENIQREDLNPLEEAGALHRLINEFDMTHQQCAEAVGRSRAAVSNLLRLLDLADEVKALVVAGELEMGHARALLALGGQTQVKAARDVAARGLSVRETERLVKRLAAPPKAPVSTRPDPDIRKLEEELGDVLGARVQVQSGRGGKGKLVISYASLDQLDGILAKIK